MYAIIETVIVILLFFYIYTRQPKGDRVSLLTCLIGFGLGAIPAFFISFFFQFYVIGYITRFIQNPVVRMIIEYFFVVAMIEELTKYISGKLLSKKCTSRIQYIAVFASVGAGFEVFESYFQVSDLMSMLIRLLLALHICFQIYMGSFYGKGKKFLAYVIPWLIHGTFDFLLTYGGYLMGISQNQDESLNGVAVLLGAAIGGIVLLVMSLNHASEIGKKCKRELEMQSLENMNQQK